MNADKTKRSSSDRDLEALGVYFAEELVGEISTSDGVSIQFQYADSWQQNEAAFPISVSLPLGEPIFDARMNVANNFFVNLLPEENIRKRTCEKLKISEGNDFELLRQIGGDCAGAISVLPVNSKPAKLHNSYDSISEKQLATWSEGDQNAFADSIGKKDVRLSLAGAQDKLPVKFDGKAFFLPKGNSPSTHILKFTSRFSHLPENEALTTMLAHAVGVSAVNVGLHQTKKSRIAIVERYDRVASDDSFVRLHQEDFCQAMGIHPQRKYQQEGGPNLQDCSQLIKEHCSVPLIELEKFIRWVVFNWLVHNADAHAKNISLLFENGQTKLSPFYDLVCTGNYPQLSKKLAMSIGGESSPGAIGPKHVDLFSREIDVSSKFVKEIVVETANRLMDASEATSKQFQELYGDSPILQRVPSIVRKRCQKVIKLFA